MELLRSSPVTSHKERAGMRPDERRTRIKRIRERADELRTAATNIRDPRMRCSMLKIAKSYENAADVLERVLARKDATNA
jgi:hypothetical protein